MDGRLVCNQDSYREVDVSIYKAEIGYTPMKNDTCAYTLVLLNMMKGAIKMNAYIYPNSLT